MEDSNISHERGQSLILTALMMLVFLGILMLAIDGGMAFAKRRAAQNAADAGALAGARTYCVDKSVLNAKFMAVQYATVHNEAQGATADVVTSTGTVAVTATIPFKTSFAQFFGRPNVTAQASASASCCPAAIGEGVLPIAWACRNPVSPDSISLVCEERALTELQVKSYLSNPLPLGQIYPELYIVMDSQDTGTDLNQICQSQGGYMDCDYDNDGEDDLIANGGRSWLDLNGGGGGSSELVTWIQNGYPGQITYPLWVGGQNGVADNVFQNVENYQVGKIVLVPIYNKICDDYPLTACPSFVEPGDSIVATSGGSYYRIFAFGAFYVTCVHAPPYGGGGTCPGHYAFSNAGIIPNNTKTIEGYFVKDVLPNAGSGDCGLVDLGAYSLTLER